MVSSDFIEKKIVEVKKYDEIGAFDGTVSKEAEFHVECENMKFPL